MRDPPEADKSPLRSDKLQVILAKANKGVFGNFTLFYKYGVSGWGTGRDNIFPPGKLSPLTHERIELV